MSDYLIMKAVEYDKLPVKFKKATPFDSLRDRGYWLQQKYDGCMGIVIGGQMLSRTGENYSASTRHLIEEVREVVDGDYAVIGEVWRPIEEAAFPAVSGQFRRQAPCPELRFIVNDIVPVKFNTVTPYHERYDQLCGAFPPGPSLRWRVQVAETSVSGAWEGSPLAWALEWQGSGGFDGAILRNPDAGYTVGTVKAGEIIKVKPTLSLDLRCNGVIQGEGKHYGKLGAITVNYKGVSSAVGTGFSDADRESMWAGALMGTDESPIDRIVEIECLGVTADGRLREPRFKGVRFDKVQPD